MKLSLSRHNFKIRLITPLALLAIASLSAHAEKKELNHDAFDDWKSVKNYSLSNDSRWMVYAVNPQAGDGELTFYDTRKGTKINIPRGYDPAFAAGGSRWAAALVKPPYSVTRTAKIDGKKDFDLPQDSLVIIDLANGNVTKIANVTGFRLGEKGGDWIAYHSCDTTYIKSGDLKDKEVGKPMVLRSLKDGKERIINWVKDYVLSKDGTRLAVRVKPTEKDSIATTGIGLVNLPDTSLIMVDTAKKFYSAPVFDESGRQLAFAASTDTIKSGTKHTKIYYAETENPLKTLRVFDLEKKDSEGKPLRSNQYTMPLFSHNGRRLIAGVAPIIAPDDTTIVDFERADLDIWRWNAPYTPPQENKNVDKLREHQLPVVIDLTTNETLLVTDNMLATVKAPDRWDGSHALVIDPMHNIVSQQWDYYAPVDLKVVNLANGETTLAGQCPVDEGELSPDAKYVYWYKDKNYYTYNIATGRETCVSQNMPWPVWDETDDHPMPSPAYGIAGWTEGDKDILVYDRYDMWALDPDGVKSPCCVTNGMGRRNNRRFRYLQTDPEARFIKPGEELLLNVFDYTDKYKGLATLDYGKNKDPRVEVLNEYSYTQVKKSKDARVYSWQRANFSTSPDIWVSVGTDFMKAKQLTDANPDMNGYKWGTAQLVKWTAYDGKESEGVLYIPDDIDPSKKYPMLSVFYETGSEDLYTHYTMEPSWSWVNYPFYVSRGYVIFVPDIHYTAGLPGESCYNYVCSGVEEMCRRYPWIDKDRIGIDGQSWGGYQTAYLITRTDMFACAGSGAPVSNMTSAFGGIRWESGDSRQGQYEQGQSRIGRNLWEAPELYIANSPIFHANKVNTPLLIMHNDADGAVPWYQGIEYFMALRRLQKPVWMLQYNGESHNIKARKNRKDITIRLQQFFDHYLKCAPMPVWMKDGIPAVRKGQELGTKISEL